MRKGELVPLRKKYFFHPSPARVGDEEYDLSDSEDDSLRASTTSESVTDEVKASKVPATSKASESELESEHSGWFRVEPSDLRIPGKADDSETEEDNDSDNCDLSEPDTAGEEGIDEWLSIPKENQDQGFTNAERNAKAAIQGSDDSDVIEAPQTHGAVVGFWFSPIFTNV